MKNLKLAGVLAALAVAASGGALYYFYAPIYKVEQRVKAMLSDPDSAKFDEVGYNPATDAGCGSVNAKNKMGGYVGWRYFVSPKNGDVIYDPGMPLDSDTPTQSVNTLQARILWMEFALKQCPVQKEKT